MSATPRRRGKAKYEKNDLLDPPAKVVTAVRRRGNVLRLGRTWVLIASVLTLFAVLFYYNSVSRGSPNTWSKNEPTQLTYDRGSEDVRDDTDAFIVADIPGKGKGMIAIRDIEQGERILTEEPAFLVPSQVSESPSAVIAKLLREASPKDREAVLNLSYVHFPENLDPETHPDEVALAIFQTNAIAAGKRVGIFPRSARMNHGCSSAFNAVYTWRDKEEVLVVHALKKINKGEEILTTYTNSKKPRAERRAFLEKKYGFTCMCQVCSLPDSESHVSDRRLMDISSSYDRLATWDQRMISGVEAIDTIRLIWSIEDEEGYWSERGQLAADAAWVAAAHSDAVATSEWAELAIEWYAYELGYDSDQVRDMDRIAIDPRSHPEWGTREVQRIGAPGRR
ncbi:SET domain-containing protein 5 [Termitomyces sp. T112]|nr:SET domain-containing protein 5 [Termitomyces sp. T112]